MTYEHSFTARWNQLGVDFAEGGKPEYLEKNPRSQIEIDKSQPTCGAQGSIPGPQRWEARALPLDRSDSLKRQGERLYLSTNLNVNAVEGKASFTLQIVCNKTKAFLLSQ